MVIGSDLVAIALVPVAPALARGEHADQQHPGNESADVGEPGYSPASVVGLAERGDPAKKLNREPVEQEEGGWNRQAREKDEQRNQRVNTRAREFDEIRAHDSRDSSTGSDGGQDGV